MNGGADVTTLLGRWQEGDAQALDALWPLVYGQLRVLAARQFRREGSGHTLQPTALVHEAYVKLVGQGPGRVENRVHFFALAAKAMRQVLVDHARRKTARKRAGDQHRITLTASLGAVDGDTEIFDLLDLHQALERLADIQPRPAKVVELRYFAGLTVEQTAEVLGVTLRTVSRDWNLARLWLLDRLHSA